MNIANGTYNARPVAASITESKAGNLMAAIRFGIEDGPELSFYSVLVKTDGTVNTRNIDDIKRWSGWDGADPYWLMDNDLTGMDVEVVIENEPSLSDPSRPWPAIKWVNPPGGGHGGLPEAADRRAVMARYGAKFRALAGGTPASARIPAARTPDARLPTPDRGDGTPYPAARSESTPCPVPAAPPVRPPARPAATQASAWGLVCELGATISQAEREALWFGFVDATGTDQTEMTPAGWAQVEKSIRDYFAGQSSAPSMAAAAGVVEDDLPY